MILFSQKIKILNSHLVNIWNGHLDIKILTPEEIEDILQLHLLRPKMN